MTAGLNYKLSCLTVYRSLLQDPVLSALRRCLDHADASNPHSLEASDAWHTMVHLLLKSGVSFRDYLLDLIAHDDNPFSRHCELYGLETCSKALSQLAAQDLRILQELYHLSPASCGFDGQNLELLFSGEDHCQDQVGLAQLKSCPDWGEQLPLLAGYYRRHSRGIIARYRALTWGADGLKGVPYPDLPRMCDLLGYESQKEQILANTRQFVQGEPANNVLLYGSRGTGKSTMVKSLLQEFWEAGLRMVEVARDQVEYLPELAAYLSDYRVPVIIFIDDLSFEDYETSYKGLKAVMEGSLQGQPKQVLIYATSNRRHLIKEYFADRSGPGEEIHTQDTMQEKLSLSDRFGLTVTFPPPGQQLYLQIVEHLVQERGIEMDAELLRQKALEWERAHHGRSGRTAHQFVNSLSNCHL
ncbi:MAG TPA: ATP-binding protein [Syntrophomonadaceae bacterium]|nr:ATP-binding protein [Syntrophomonadaceae bacterium]HQA08186.1 ATP-binding protein [Syntrophomonadaceae bacterium]HQE23454.1 ATP-binding protein [Syntrophomonadaceae bacterium]